MGDALPSDLRAWAEAMQTDTMANMTLVDIAAVNGECPSEDMGKAADEIERLRAENEQLRAALKEVNRRTGLLLHQNTGRWNMTVEHDARTVGVLGGNQALARAALREERDE